MTDPKLKYYAVTVTVKPAPVGSSKYQSIMFRGLALAKNPNEAKELVSEMLLRSFDPNKQPKITKEVIKIKDCKLHNDFCIKAGEHGSHGL